MDYKQKYLKYKSKYLDYKKQLISKKNNLQKGGNKTVAIIASIIAVLGSIPLFSWLYQTNISIPNLKQKIEKKIKSYERMINDDKKFIKNSFEILTNILQNELGYELKNYHNLLNILNGSNKYYYDYSVDVLIKKFDIIRTETNFNKLQKHFDYLNKDANNQLVIILYEMFYYFNNIHSYLNINLNQDHKDSFKRIIKDHLMKVQIPDLTKPSEKPHFKQLPSDKIINDRLGVVRGMLKNLSLKLQKRI